MSAGSQKLYGAVERWRGGVVDVDGRKRESVRMTLPLDMFDATCVSVFRDRVASVIDGGGHITFENGDDLVKSRTPGDQDYLLLFQECFRPGVMRTLGLNPVISQLKKIPMYTFSGPTTGRNYYFVVDADGHMRLCYDAGCEVAWAVVMRSKGIKIGTKDELRALNACAAGPLVRPKTMVSLSDEMLLANSAHVDVRSDRGVRRENCGCVAGWMHDNVDPRVIRGARTLGDVVNNAVFSAACGSMGDVSHGGLLGQRVLMMRRTDRGLRVFDERDMRVGDDTWRGPLRVLYSAGEFLDDPLWCGCCAVFDSAHLDGDGKRRCYDCGERYTSDVAPDMLYDDMLLNTESHPLLRAQAGIGWSTHNEDVGCLVNKIASAGGAGTYNQVRAALIPMMTVAGKAQFCRDQLCLSYERYDRWPDRSLAYWFDFAYDGAFRLAYLMYHYAKHGLADTDDYAGYRSLYYKGHADCRERVDVRYLYDVVGGTVVWPKGAPVAERRVTCKVSSVVVHGVCGLVVQRVDSDGIHERRDGRYAPSYADVLTHGWHVDARGNVRAPVTLNESLQGSRGVSLLDKSWKNRMRDRFLKHKDRGKQLVSDVDTYDYWSSDSEVSSIIIESKG